MIIKHELEINKHGVPSIVRDAYSVPETGEIVFGVAGRRELIASEPEWTDTIEYYRCLGYTSDPFEVVDELSAYYNESSDPDERNKLIHQINMMNKIIEDIWNDVDVMFPNSEISDPSEDAWLDRIYAEDDACFAH